MGLRIKLSAFSLFLISFGWSLPAVASVSERPLGGVRDEAKLLSLKTTKTIEKLIAEHQNLTQETILFSIWTGNPEGGLEAATRDTFHEWKRSTVKPTSVVLIGVDAKSGEFDIQVGIGLESILNRDEIERIRDRYFKPEYSQGAIDRPFYLSFLEVLKVLDSPLIQNGKAEAWIREAGFPGEFRPVEPTTHATSFWWVWIVLGVIGLGGFFFVVFEKEAHYTAGGWAHVRRFPFFRRLFGGKKKLGQGLITGGGVSGRW